MNQNKKDLLRIFKLNLGLFCLTKEELERTLPYGNFLSGTNDDKSDKESFIVISNFQFKTSILSSKYKDVSYSYPVTINRVFDDAWVSLINATPDRIHKYEYRVTFSKQTEIRLSLLSFNEDWWLVKLPNKQMQNLL